MKVPRWLKKTLGVLLGLILFFGAWVSWTLFVTHPFPLPELARNLPSPFSEGNSVFNDRVKNKFSGTQKEAVIVEELRKEGFTIIDGVDEVGRRRAVLMGSKFPCTLRWEVSWFVSKDGIVSDIIGDYGEAGCL
jgi:hypothetical protein